MKIQTMLFVLLLVSHISYSQLPVGPDGKTLYQKGECKVLVPNVSYECVFCTDEALTQNCKKYKCSPTECKEVVKTNGSQELSKPIKMNGVKLKLPSATVKTPDNALFEMKDTTSKLPKGLYEKDGEVFLEKGYTIKPSSNGKYKMIFAASAGSAGGVGATVGGFVCVCKSDGGNCSVVVSGSSISCKCGIIGKCRMVVSTEETVVARVFSEGKDTPSPQTGWKEYKISAKKAD